MNESHTIDKRYFLLTENLFSGEIVFEHIKKLKGVSYFAAPYGKKVTPATIVFSAETIELVTGGTIFFEIDGERKTFRKGAMFWHVSREKTIWDTPPDDPYRCYVFHFEARPPTRTVPRVTVWNSSDEALEFSSAMFKVFHSGEFEQEALTAYIYSTLRWQALASRKLPDAVYPEALNRALKYLDANFTSNIAPEDAAEHAGISRPYLFKIFRDYLRTSPHQYLLKRRFDKAKLLLAGETFSIKEIAADCGFESIEVFYRQFKANSHTTPAEYRKKYSIHR